MSPQPRSEAQVACDFWVRVRETKTGCWERPPKNCSIGYGVFYYKGCKELSHRVAWMMIKGAIPADRLVLHRCDNPLCVRPSHLFLGTHKDNTQDMIKKGRRGVWPIPSHLRARGARNASSKLTVEKVKEIRKLYAVGDTTYSALAEQFDVALTTIWNIVSFKIWAWVK